MLAISITNVTSVKTITGVISQIRDISAQRLISPASIKVENPANINKISPPSSIGSVICRKTSLRYLRCVMGFRFLPRSLLWSSIRIYFSMDRSCSAALLGIGLFFQLRDIRQCAEAVGKIKTIPNHPHIWDIKTQVVQRKIWQGAFFANQRARSQRGW